MSRWIVAGPAAPLVWMVASAQGQQLPDAGRLLEQNKPVLTLPQREPPKIEKEETPKAAQEADGTRIPVAHLKITGATQFTESELHALVADAEGREQTLADLQRLAERLTRHYRAHGFLLARAYLPAQEVERGEVRIAVLEGTLGQVVVDNAAHVGGGALAPLSRLKPGDVAHDRTLETTLLLLSDVPGVEVRSTLKPGATPGATDLLVDVQPGRGATGSIDADNYGDRFSGQYRLGGTLNLNNPLRLGDQIMIRATLSNEGMKYVRASYQLPVGMWGTRLGAAGSDMHYHLGGTAADLDASGQARTVSVYALHPVMRGAAGNLSAQLQYDHIILDDRIGSTATALHKSLNIFGIGLNADFQDELAGGGQTSISVNRADGTLALDTVTDSVDAATARTAGSFSRWNASLLRLQRVTGSMSLYLSATAQFASKNLDSSQKMSLGGANGVRAYPQGEAAGDEGAQLSVEGRYSVPAPWAGLWQAIAFVDTGHIIVNKSPWAAATNSRTLSAAGVGLNVARDGKWSLKASLAWRLGTNAPTSDRDRSPRLWIQAVGLLS